VKHPNAEVSEIVILERRKLKCSCQESIFEGVCCHHEICIANKVLNTAKNLDIHQRWTKPFFSMDDLPRRAEVVEDGADGDESEDEDAEDENYKEEEENSEDEDSEEKEEEEKEHSRREEENIHEIVTYKDLYK